MITISDQHKATKIVKQIDGGGLSTPVHHVWNVIAKINSGHYRTEKTRCFCGADKGQTISNFDRYGIPHTMVLCQECGIIRANPRMTAESYKEFYDKEYRNIYVDNEPPKKEFLAHIQGGMSLMDFSDYYDLKKDTVVDIGCNMGAWLMPFKDAGSEVYGVDYDSNRVAIGQEFGLDIVSGGVEKLIEREIRADIIILNHVLEHLLDIESELDNIRKIIKPDGVLFIGVPGIYYWQNPKNMIQNAHVWQFNADTLEYVMNCCGWDAWHLDEYIWSVWKPIGKKLERKIKPAQAVESVARFLNGDMTKLPKIRTMTKFSLKERKKNIDESMAYQLPNIRDLANKYSGEAVLVSGGPSINGYEEKIRELQFKGAKVITIERMYDWCHDNGIVPDFCAILDACDDVVDGLQNIRKGTKWLISAIANKATMDILHNEDAYIFFTEQKGIEQHEMWYKHGYEKIRIINSGGSVALASFSLAMALGFRKIHVFGLDCHVTKRNYAKGIKGEGVVRDTFEVKIDDRIYMTTSPYLSFMQQFFVLYASGKSQGLLDDVMVYGDSLIKAAAKIDIDGDKEDA